MTFDNIYAFYILIILVILVFISGSIKDYEQYFSNDMLKKIIIGKNKKRLNFGLLIGSFIFLIIAIARPIIENKPIKVPQSDVSIVVAFDISKSMICEDVYPSRLDFAKNKFDSLLMGLKDEKVGALGFSSRAFLIAPITNDYSTLRYLIKNLNLDYVNVKGSSIKEALISTNELLNSSSKKALIVFTDGTDNDTFKEEIEYAKSKKIKVFVYAIATQKGGVIKLKDGGIQKDSNGNIVVTRLNDNIKELAFATDGAYLEFSTSSTDIKRFVDEIKNKFKSKQKKDVIIKNNDELYYYPLGIAFVLFLVATSGFKRFRR